MVIVVMSLLLAQWIKMVNMNFEKGRSVLQVEETFAPVLTDPNSFQKIPLPPRKSPVESQPEAKDQQEACIKRLGLVFIDKGLEFE